jgi:hypothetical protein
MNLRRALKRACHFDQTHGWSCGISAAQSVLRFLGNPPPTSSELIERLRSFGLSDTLNEGLSTPHLAFLLRELSRAPLQVLLHPNSLKDLGGQFSRCPLSLNQPIKPLLGINPFWSKGMNRALSLLLADGVRIRVGRFGLKDITANKPAIVSVACAEYYGLKLPLYDETHFLALLPVNNNEWIVCDSYELRGYEEVKGWRQHLDFSGHYDWSRWRGDAILIM